MADQIHGASVAGFGSLPVELLRRIVGHSIYWYSSTTKQNHLNRPYALALQSTSHQLSQIVRTYLFQEIDLRHEETIEPFSAVVQQDPALLNLIQQVFLGPDMSHATTESAASILAVCPAVDTLVFTACHPLDQTRLSMIMSAAPATSLRHLSIFGGYDYNESYDFDFRRLVNLSTLDLDNVTVIVREQAKPQSLERLTIRTPAV